MRRIITSFAILLVLTSILVSCGQKSDLKDGLYYAEQASYSESGWKAQVVIQVSSGKITSVNWNATNNMALADKKTVAANGGYGMIRASKIGKEWHEQARAVEDFLVKTQDTAFSQFDESGHTDAISGASMEVKEFFELVKRALAGSPVAKGSYKKDGWYYVVDPAVDQSGYHNTVLLTVVNGRIVNTTLNCLAEDGSESKVIKAINGAYKMNGPSGEWDVQIARIEKAIVENQGFAALNVNSEGKADAVSGVSITVGEFARIFEEAARAAN